jgi:hypothetical protein
MGFCGWAGNSPKENNVLISKDAQPWISADQIINELARKTGSTILKNWTTLYSRNTPLITSLEEEKIVDAPGNDANASMPEQVKRPNPWRKMMMMLQNAFAP